MERKKIRKRNKLRQGAYISFFLLASLLRVTSLCFHWSPQLLQVRCYDNDIIIIIAGVVFPPSLHFSSFAVRKRFIFRAQLKKKELKKITYQSLASISCDRGSYIKRTERERFIFFVFVWWIFSFIIFLLFPILNFTLHPLNEESQCFSALFLTEDVIFSPLACDIKQMATFCFILLIFFSLNIRGDKMQWYFVIVIEVIFSFLNCDTVTVAAKKEKNPIKWELVSRVRGFCNEHFFVKKIDELIIVINVVRY